MNTIIIDLIFSIFTIYLLIKTISYSIYEIKTEKNKSGGISLIVFSTICILFGNIMFWLI